MNVYCDESGGVGRGVMTLAALAIAEGDADQVLSAIREATGLRGELKGSRIDLETRAFVFDQLDQVFWRAMVSVAISATQPETGKDRGDHDAHVYAALLEDAVTALLPLTGGCASITIDEGRYSDAVLLGIRRDIAELIGPCGAAALQESHRSAGLQLADVIANSFFNRALPSDRQAAIAATVQPRLEARRVQLRILDRDQVN